MNRADLESRPGVSLKYVCQVEMLNRLLAI